MSTTSPPYPLRLREVLRNYGFGGRWMAEAFAKDGLPADHRLAETWEACDRPGGESNVIVNGPLAGRTLHEAIELWGEGLLGWQVAERFGRRFPLLIKFLDATHALSEQAHPDDALTVRWGLEDFSGKTEAWYMLDVRLGARAFAGHRAGVTEKAFTEAILAGRSRECMVEHAPRPGDAFLLYAGTPHYSPGGLLFYEIMQNSDVYVGLRAPSSDLPEPDRRARAERAVEALHLEAPFDCRPRPVVLDEGANRHTYVLACEPFALERLDLAGPGTLGLDGRRFAVLSVIAGQAAVTQNGCTETLRLGQSLLLPAGGGDAEIRPEGSVSALIGYVPDLAGDVIAPLHAAGCSDAAIAALGGVSSRNALAALL